MTAGETTSLGTLEERLQRLESIESARRLLARYARACDAQDVEAVAGLFAPDCELEIPGGSWTGVDGVRSFYRAAWEEDPSRKSHFITNVEAHQTGPGIVVVDSYFMYTAAGDGTSVLGWGEYHDVVDTTGGDPAFRKKSMAVTRAGDIREGWALGQGPT